MGLDIGGQRAALAGQVNAIGNGQRRAGCGQIRAGRRRSASAADLGRIGEAGGRRPRLEDLGGRAAGSAGLARRPEAGGRTAYWVGQIGRAAYPAYRPGYPDGLPRPAYPGHLPPTYPGNKKPRGLPGAHTYRLPPTAYRKPLRRSERALWKA